MLEKLFTLKATFNQGRRLPFGSVIVIDFTRFQLVEDHIGHNRPFLLTKRLPVIPGAHHLFGRVTGQDFQGMVPVGHHMIAIDDKGGDGAALNDLGKGFFHSHKAPFRSVKASVAVHDDVCGFAETLIDPCFNVLSADRPGRQGAESALAYGFQLQQIPQKT